MGNECKHRRSRGHVPLSWDPQEAGAIAWATGMGQTIVISAGNGHANLDLDYSQNGAGAIVVGGSQNDGYNWPGSSYGRIVHLAAGAKGIWASSYDPSTNQGYHASVDGTSFAAPMVAATAAICRMLYRQNGGDLPGWWLPHVLTQIIYGSAHIAPTSGGEQLGFNLDVLQINPGGNAKMRELNVANAYEISKRPIGQGPIVRVFNNDDDTWWTDNQNWGQDGSFSNKSFLGYDTIYDARSIGLTSSDLITFKTYNGCCPRSHGYQIYRGGFLKREQVSGTTQRRAPWGILHGTFGEDGGVWDSGWHYEISWPAIE